LGKLIEQFKERRRVEDILSLAVALHCRPDERRCAALLFPQSFGNLKFL
jgi:hypothetical protein